MRGVVLQFSLFFGNLHRKLSIKWSLPFVSVVKIELSANGISEEFRPSHNRFRGEQPIKPVLIRVIVRCLGVPINQGEIIEFIFSWQHFSSLLVVWHVVFM
jgi:hypothetical protein